MTRDPLPELKTMSLGEHLDELRSRVLKAVISLTVSTVICWVIFDPVIVNFMKAPLDMIAGTTADNPFAFHNPLLDLIRDKMNPDIEGLGKLKVLRVFEPIIIRFRVSLLAGVIMASPVIITQAWKFVESGLYEHEKRYAVTYGAASLVLFLVGCAFSFFMLFPVAVAVLLGDTSFEVVLRLEHYVSEATFFTIGVGSMFELPLVLLFMASIGIVDSGTLAGKRRHVILAILVIAAIITPPDPLTQTVVAIPIYGLYEATILVLKIRERRSAGDYGQETS